MALIVSHALPKGLQTFDQIDGVWVTEPRCAVAISEFAQTGLSAHPSGSFQTKVTLRSSECRCRLKPLGRLLHHANSLAIGGGPDMSRTSSIALTAFGLQPGNKTCQVIGRRPK
jgi:hypothetical protein